jgi:hypothetical protein
MHAPARHAQIEMRRIPRIHDDRMQLCPIGRAILCAARTAAIIGVVVKTRNTVPRLAAVLAAEQGLWGCARVPDARLADMAWVSQKVWSTERSSSPIAALGKAGRVASLQLFPMS